jgi:arylsulfatase A-like enzyme
VRLVSVTAWTGVPPGHNFNNVQTWDMHGGGLGGIFDHGQHGLGWALPRTDEAVSALLEDLSLRGMIDSTLVVMVGEFGRTPAISNPAGNAGREHHPACYSAMLAGGSIKGGRVWGASDSRGALVREAPVRPEDFGATLLHALGVPPETRLGADGFSGPASMGLPITSLLD